MNNGGRLFDCLAVQAQQPKTDLLNAKVAGVWKAYSTAEVHDMVYQLASALLDMGISAGDGTTVGRDKVGLISPGRPEWIIVDLAVQLTGAILVPFYPNSNAKEIELILNEAEVKCIFVSDAAMFEKISSIQGNVPSMHSVYSFDSIPGCKNWTTLLQPINAAKTDIVKAVSDKVKEDDVTTIIFTSGTTGRPKGVMLTHKNIVSNVECSNQVLSQIPLPEKKCLSFLPLNHIFEKTCTYMYLTHGFSIYYAESIDQAGANMREVNPYLFTAVPRVLEKIFERIMIVGNGLTGIKRKLFLWSVELAEQFQVSGNSPWYKFKLAIADKLIFTKWREALGGNVVAMTLGSSACPVRLEKIFTAAKMVILEGYGLTETSPVISVNHYDPKYRKFGTVGPLIPDVEVKIAADGEILARGPNIMVGYYKNPELTAEVMEGGWFHTGDIGEMDSEGFLKITDRKKEIFKTSGGKYVAPVPIEMSMKASPFIEQMMVIGADRKFTSALIVPSYANLKVWCAENKVECLSHQQVINDPAVMTLFQSTVDSFNHDLNHVEKIKRITLLPEEWTVEGGELTPTGKMKRRVIMEKYGDKVEQMYTSEVGSVSVTY
jgi:long-chain acyl-CoA synthetase